MQSAVTRRAGDRRRLRSRAGRAFALGRERRQGGHAPAPAAPAESDLRATERLAIDYADAAELADKAAKALKALAANQPAIWKALRAQGIFRGQVPRPRWRSLPRTRFAVREHAQAAARRRTHRGRTFAEADRVMTPLLGKPLSEYIFVDQTDAERSPRRKTIYARPRLLSPPCWPSISR